MLNFDFSRKPSKEILRGLKLDWVGLNNSFKSAILVVDKSI